MSVHTAGRAEKEMNLDTSLNCALAKRNGKKRARTPGSDVRARDTKPGDCPVGIPSAEPTATSCSNRISFRPSTRRCKGRFGKQKAKLQQGHRLQRARQLRAHSAPLERTSRSCCCSFNVLIALHGQQTTISSVLIQQYNVLMYTNMYTS